MNEPRKLYRSEKDQVIAGVCGGLAEYFSIDPVLVRALFVLLALFGGGGFVLYLILWIVIPKASAAPAGSEDTLRQGFEEVRGEARKMVQGGRSSATLGWILLLVGAWFLLDNLGWLRVNGDLLWPALLIGLGVVLLLRERNR
ncbi:phage shock protein C [Calidithermus terrae]|uniref:Phage shock protein C n=1 Tax=Calidithermus terrae TaxID=1408545 RepID=A0A399F509_9DEIN|nr:MULTISPECIES: PspC domain-containing protein [Calidithermus]RIH90369.1 phage shock protein C [Calidithermus terrae]